MLSFMEAARTKWPGIPDDVPVVIVKVNSVVFPTFGWKRHADDDPVYGQAVVTLRSIGGYMLGYDKLIGILCVNFTGERHAN